MQPLKINAKCVADADTRLEYIKSAIGRGLPEFGPSEPNDREVVLVGTGPSVRGELKTIKILKKSGAMIIAVKGAHDYLIEHNIIPHGAVCVDPLPDQTKYYQRILPRKAITRPLYFIASQCHPNVFDHLTGQEIILWHLLAASSQEFLGKRLQVGGGSTSGSRGIVLCWLMGFRKFHLFGFDSCLAGDDKVRLRKIDGEQWGSKESEQTLELYCEGETFYADPAMAAQANEIQDVVKMLEGARFKAYGHGLLQTVFKTNAAKGMGGYYAVSDEFGERGVPPIRPEDVEQSKRDLQATRLGVYRGRNYFGGVPQSAPEATAKRKGLAVVPNSHVRIQPDKLSV